MVIVFEKTVENCYIFSSTLSQGLKLLSLDLSWNLIQQEGGEILSQGIKDSVSLKGLDLSWNALGSSKKRGRGRKESYNSATDSSVKKKTSKHESNRASELQLPSVLALHENLLHLE